MKTEKEQLIDIEIRRQEELYELNKKFDEEVFQVKKYFIEKRSRDVKAESLALLYDIVYRNISELMQKAQVTDTPKDKVKDVAKIHIVNPLDNMKLVPTF